MPDSNGWSKETLAISRGRPSRTPGTPINVPPVLATSFHAGVERSYARDDGTPTWEALEDVLGALEGGTRRHLRIRNGGGRRDLCKRSVYRCRHSDDELRRRSSLRARVRGEPLDSVRAGRHHGTRHRAGCRYARLFAVAGKSDESTASGCRSCNADRRGARTRRGRSPSTIRSRRRFCNRRSRSVPSSRYIRPRNTSPATATSRSER